MLNAISDTEAREDALAELNVKYQVRNLINTSIIQDAWKNDHRPVIHGWIYGLKDGILKPLLVVNPEEEHESNWEVAVENGREQ
jgi:carbonic anhydrase